MTTGSGVYPPYDTPEEKEAHHNQTVVKHELLDDSAHLFNNASDVDADADQALDPAHCNPSRGMRLLAAWQKADMPAPAQARGKQADVKKQNAVHVRR
jgi:hypothetical protein